MLDALLQAIRDDDAATVERLLDQDASLLAQRDAQGVSPLSLAAYHGRSALLERLQRRHVPDFWEACIVGDQARVRAALDAGQGIDAFAPDGFTPLGLVVFFGHATLARPLLEAGADPSLRARNVQQVGPIHAAVARGDLDTLATLLAHGGDPRLPQAQQITPLHVAAAHGQAAMIGLLCLYGAEPDARDAAARRAADRARERGHVALAAQLDTFAQRLTPAS